jgi:hypothetical protein
LSALSPVVERVDAHTARVTFEADGWQLTRAEVLALWKSDDAFCDAFSACLAGQPLDGFAWETPPWTKAGLRLPFECIVADSPALAREGANIRPFAAQLASGPPGVDVVAFRNLGGDAELVAPRDLGQAGDYAHLASFLRTAPTAQSREVWRLTAEGMERWLESNAPFWVSTAGLGVAWVHIRIDSRPKYYRYAPYRALPRA